MGMGCQHIQRELTAIDLREGKLPSELSAHLAGCKRCQTFWEQEGRLWDLLDVYRPVEPAEGYRRRFWKLIARGRQPRIGGNRSGGRLAPLARRVGVAAVVLICLSSVMMILYSGLPALRGIEGAVSSEWAVGPELEEINQIVAHQEMLEQLTLLDSLEVVVTEEELQDELEDLLEITEDFACVSREDE
jgi:hypothetical protein